MSVAATHASDLLRVRHETPGPAAAWRRCVHGLPDPHLAHSHQWASIIHRAYGHQPLYLAADGGDGEAGLLPAFIIRRPFFGTTVSSMPFLDGGGPCGATSEVQKRLVETMIGEALRVGASVAEIRCSRRLDIPWQPAEHKVNMLLALPSNADDLWTRLGGSVRNQIRKATRAGLTVDCGGAEYLDAFYGIFTIRMRELGSPVHDRAFFRAIVDEFGPHARIAVVRQGETPVGALFALAFRDTLTVPWASCLRPSLTLCSNMLLYWDTIRTACGEGFRRFDFGRSSRDSGTYRFKRQWGAVESPLFWYTIPIDGRPRATHPHDSDGRVAACLTSAWRHLPLAVTRGVGPRIRRYLTQ
jgi:FemAB-related protein (PEP-CTERM system-associated)